METIPSASIPYDTVKHFQRLEQIFNSDAVLVRKFGEGVGLLLEFERLEIESDVIERMKNDKVPFQGRLKELLNEWVSKHETDVTTLGSLVEMAQNTKFVGVAQKLKKYIHELQDLEAAGSDDSQKKDVLHCGIAQLQEYHKFTVVDDKGASIVLQAFEKSNKNKSGKQKYQSKPYLIKILAMLDKKDELNCVYQHALDRMENWDIMNSLELERLKKCGGNPEDSSLQPNNRNILRYNKRWTGFLSQDVKREFEDTLGFGLYSKFKLPENHPDKITLCFTEMDMCKTNLRNYLFLNDTPTSGDRMELFKEIVHGVAFIHAQHDDNIYINGHGNLCPETILLLDRRYDTNGARLVIANKSRKKSNKYCGLYTAPEYKDEEVADEDERPSDLFALGVILFELFCPSAQHQLFVALHSLPGKYGKDSKAFKQKWPRVVDMIEVLMDADRRPTAAELKAVLETNEFKVETPEDGWVWRMDTKKDEGTDWLTRFRDADDKGEDEESSSEVESDDSIAGEESDDSVAGEESDDSVAGEESDDSVGSEESDDDSVGNEESDDDFVGSEESEEYQEIEGLIANILHLGKMKDDLMMEFEEVDDIMTKLKTMTDG